jgi:hypothetical protein
MVKKIRLIDEETETSIDTSTETSIDTSTETSAVGGSFTQAEKEKLLEFAEAIDWKLWEILKILKEQEK